MMSEILYVWDLTSPHHRILGRNHHTHDLFGNLNRDLLPSPLCPCNGHRFVELAYLPSENCKNDIDRLPQIPQQSDSKIFSDMVNFAHSVRKGKGTFYPVTVFPFVIPKLYYWTRRIASMGRVSGSEDGDSGCR